MKDNMKTNFDHGGNVFAVARSLGVPPEEILDFSASINPLGPAPGVRDALATVFNRLVHYPDSDCTELREALAFSHGVEPANICVANGSTQLIYLLPRLTPGKRALVIAPAFSEYAKALTRDGWVVEQFILEAAEGFAIPFDRLEKGLRDGYDLLILGNPGNPTGQLYPLAVVQKIDCLCRAAGCFLVLDEAFMDFCEEGSAKHYAVERDSILVLRSMTKFHALPGMRLGYAIAQCLAYCPAGIAPRAVERQYPRPGGRARFPCRCRLCRGYPEACHLRTGASFCRAGRHSGALPIPLCRKLPPGGDCRGKDGGGTCRTAPGRAYSDPQLQLILPGWATVFSGWRCAAGRKMTGCLPRFQDLGQVN